MAGARVPVLGQVPIDMRLREAGDNGKPLVLAQPDSPAARELMKIAEGLAGQSRGLAGRPLGLTPGLTGRSVTRSLTAVSAPAWRAGRPSQPGWASSPSTSERRPTRVPSSGALRQR